jgi:hypothetical protein
MPNQSWAFAGLRSGVAHAYSSTAAMPQSVWPSVEIVLEM